MIRINDSQWSLGGFGPWEVTISLTDWSLPLGFLWIGWGFYEIDFLCFQVMYEGIP